jgi:hypothetical protein
MRGAVASFAEALEENPAPRRLGDVRLRYEPGRLLGESLPPSCWRRQLPGAGLVLGMVAVALVGFALQLEAQLGRRRFVLHFPTVRVEHIGAKEQEALLRVWRLLHNTFGLRGAGLAGA